MDKEKDAIQTLLGKHKKLGLRKKKNRHDFDICHLHLNYCKNIVIGKLKKERERERELKKAR